MTDTKIKKKRISKKQKIYNECIILGINLPKPYTNLSKKITLNKLYDILNKYKENIILDNISESSYDTSDFEDNTDIE